MKILFLLFLIVQISLQDSCHYDTGTSTLDLKKLAPFAPFQSYNHFDDTKVTNSSTLVTYFFHPCNDTKLGEGTDGCKEEFSLCERKANVSVTTPAGSAITNITISQPSYTILGRSSDGVFKQSNNSLFLTYKSGKVVQFVCTASLPLEQSNFVQISEDNLIFYSSAACLIQHVEPSHSVGSILLLILGIVMIIYFIGGYLFKYIMQGSRGFEAFPHYEFWTDLPGLVRDGILFIQNGCRPAAATQDSYESI